MRVGSLFSGIGGFDLGLERAGFTTSWFCEQDDYCRRVLAKHWPEVPCYPDVQQLRGDSVEPVEVLCGGFPCQDLSRAGRRAGLDGAKSGLWDEFVRLIRELRPEYVLVENVVAIKRHLGRVLADLAESGYDAEWECIQAADAGAPHPRDRLWLLAYPSSRRHGPPHETVFAGRAGTELHGGWAPEPAVGRVADGLSGGLERHRRAQCRALGNALVPQIAEWLGHCIMDYERRRLAA